MITLEKTPYYVDNPKRPKCVERTPIQPGDTVFLSLAFGFLGLLVGIILAVLTDGLFVGGAGFDENEASDAFYWMLALTMALSAVVTTVALTQVLPRCFKPTYFTSNRHRNAHVEFNSLSVESQADARPVYDALASFDDPYWDANYSEEYELFNEAYDLWCITYNNLSERDNRSRTDLSYHRALLEDARDAAKVLES